MNLFVKWLLYTIAIIFVAWIVPGISISNFLTAGFVVIVFALINLVIKPVLMFISIPINILTLGLFTLVINALLFWLTGVISPGFNVSGFWAALLGSIIFSILSTFISNAENKAP